MFNFNFISCDIFSLSMEMSRLTRDGTAEPVSRDQILRHARGQGNIIFSVQLTTSRIGNLTRLTHTLLYVMTIHTYMTPYTVHRMSSVGGCAARMDAFSFFLNNTWCNNSVDTHPTIPYPVQQN